MENKEVRDFYIRQLRDDFYPYWRKYEDDEYGGILNCIDNKGEKLISEDKYTWSQGRYLWVLSKLLELSNQNLITDMDSEHLRKHGEKTYNFIKNNAIHDDSKCYYLLTREGKAKKDPISSKYDASIFADCFALIGMAEYVRVSDSSDELDTVIQLYESIKNRILSSNYDTEPYSIPEGYRNHSIPMIMLNTTYEYMLLLDHYGNDITEHKKYLMSLVDIILDEFYDYGFIREFISNGKNKDVMLLDRHINPGHTLEDMWFIIEALSRYGDLNKYIEKIILVSKKTFNAGWDEEFGGLFRFIDKDGGAPKGEVDDSLYTKLIQNTHDMKLWWPHSESLYLPLLLYKLTNDDKYMLWYNKVHNYVFESFPNKKIGEWIQIRERDGKPVEKVVALPVKDPFHIIRNFIKIIEL